MFGFYVSSSLDKTTVKYFIEEYLYSRYSHLPPNVIHSIEIAFPTFKVVGYIVVLNIDIDMIPDLFDKLTVGIEIAPNVICQHINVY